MNKIFFFTYSCGGDQPFNGGWTEVEAPNRTTAVQLFRIVHPDAEPGVVNCAFIYSEKEFANTSMAKTGNFGKFAQERVSLKVENLRKKRGDT